MSRLNSIYIVCPPAFELSILKRFENQHLALTDMLPRKNTGQFAALMATITS